MSAPTQAEISCEYPELAIEPSFHRPHRCDTSYASAYVMISHAWLVVTVFVIGLEYLFILAPAEEYSVVNRSTIHSSAERAQCTAMAPSLSWLCTSLLGVIIREM
jgi:hypothetical protein